MDTFFYIILFIFGTLFGSFGSVIIHRLKSGEAGIMTGRSHCGNCNIALTWTQLIPIVSWIWTKWICKNCTQSISAIYPLLEISTGATWAAIGYFFLDMQLIAQADSLALLESGFWLTIGWITILYIYYDILFLEIHDMIMGAGVAIVLWAIIWQTWWYDIVYPLSVSSWSIESIWALWLLSLCIVGLYIIMLKWFHEIIDIIILCLLWAATYAFAALYGSSYPWFQASIWALAIFSFFFIQIVISRWKWMWGGDLRIALFIGMLLGSSLWAAGLFATYIVGSIIGIWLIGYSKLKNGWNSQTVTQVPFGPFLWLWCFIALFYMDTIAWFISLYLLY